MTSRLKKFIPGALRNQLREFRWSPAAVRWLPGDSNWFGPPRRWARLETYFQSRPDELREVLPAGTTTPVSVETIGKVPSRFVDIPPIEIPAGCVFSLKNARLVGAEGWVVTADDTFLIDAAFESRETALAFRKHYIFRSRRGRARPVRRLEGHCLSIGTDYAAGGFGHFIHDSLTRLLLVERAGHRLTDFDWLYAPRLKTPAVNQLIARLGFPADRLLNFDPTRDLSCDRLTATSFPGIPGHIAPAYAQFVRSRFAPPPQRRDRRIYLSRRGFRRDFDNRTEVEALLERHGFEEVRADTDAETFQKCAEAAYIFSSEGANFFNAIFAPAGTRVLLVFPDRLPHSVPYALTLASACGFRTLVMGGASVGPEGGDGGELNFHVDLSALQSALERLLRL